MPTGIQKVIYFVDYYLTLVFDTTFVKMLIALDQQVTTSLLYAGIQTRPKVNSNGLWCCLLLPSVLCIYSLLYEVSILYKVIASLSFGLLIYSVLFTLFASVSCLILNNYVYGGCVSSALIPILLIYTFLGQGLFFSIATSISAVYLYSTLMRICLISHPKTFTVGEAMIVAQGISLSAVMIAIKLFQDLEDNDEETKFMNTIVNTVLSAVLWIVSALYLLSNNQRNLVNLCKIFGVAAIYALMILRLVLGEGFLPKIFFIVFDKNRSNIFMFWLLLVVIAVLVLTFRTKMAVKASTVTRKSFHLLASAVFMSGIIMDVNLIKMAAGIGFSLVILLEALRKSRIEPISSVLQSAFDVYSDEKDMGSFAMTPLYLFVGLWCPLLLVPAHGGAALERLAGVLSVGVGDTAASWAGAGLGSRKWASDNQKTIEGTAFNILSQVALVYALQLFEVLPVRNALIRACAAAAAAAALEAHTQQVDNLVLPLVTLLAFQATAQLA